MAKFIKQVPEVDGDWLYKDQNGERIFSQEVYLPEGSQPWAECTEAEKEEWEKEHPLPEE